ncbi:MAG: ATP phosphoribosyltransferase [Chitinophagaceae bacterium]|nr:MAG: ATP phosphoribosyltransferase [Chitinophagaceae bacterium]
MQNKTVLRIAVQKSGRLYEDSVKLLKECGIDLRNVKDRLKTVSENFPLEVFFLRDDDIPEYVEDGVADIGIVGQNVLGEKSRQIKLVESLGFGKCRLSIAIPKNMEYDGVSTLQGKRIATSYPRLVKEFLSKHNVQASIHEISGSVEIAPGIGLADVVADLVSSGGTLFMNGLKEVETILDSQAVLVSNNKLDQERIAILEKLLFRIRSVKRANKSKYVLLNAPNDQLEKIISLLPGMRSPTVLPLAESGWSSVHCVLSEEEFWDKIEQLKEAGAEGILVVPIEKMIL